MANPDQSAQAPEAVHGKKGFYIHLAVFVLVNVVLLLINLFVTPERFWFKWPLLGWGIGVFFHGLAVFVFCGGSPGRKRMIARQ